jgi:hypothetical protein
MIVYNMIGHNARLEAVLESTASQIPLHAPSVRDSKLIQGPPKPQTPVLEVIDHSGVGLQAIEEDPLASVDGGLEHVGDVAMAARMRCGDEPLAYDGADDEETYNRG